MTVSYTSEVATAGKGNFWRLLARWKGSIYKAVLIECTAYFLLFACVSMFYRLYISEHPHLKVKFELFRDYCSSARSQIPISFVLGFYVSQIVTRWWNQWLLIPWPDNLAILLAANVTATDEKARLIRRTVMRYVNVAFVLVMRRVSPQALKRFPTIEHVVATGLLTPRERDLLENTCNVQTSKFGYYWMPILWASNIISRARDEGYVRDDYTNIELQKLLRKFRAACGDLLGYDGVPIPLVYTQVTTLAVYFYFGSALFANQFISAKHKEIDVYFPIFLFLEFFFYTGWLKVAETMVNPFGEDDDDFEVNWLIDRFVIVAFMQVDAVGDRFPELTRDIWWDEVVPASLPYTRATKHTYKPLSPIAGSARIRKMDAEDMDLIYATEKGDVVKSVLLGNEVNSNVEGVRRVYPYDPLVDSMYSELGGSKPSDISREPSTK